MDYLSDGIDLYEILAEQTTRNYGLAGGWFHEVLVRDCRTERELVFGDSELELCAPVGPAA